MAQLCDFCTESAILPAAAVVVSLSPLPAPEARLIPWPHRRCTWQLAELNSYSNSSNINMGLGDVLHNVCCWLLWQLFCYLGAASTSCVCLHDVCSPGFSWQGFLRILVSNTHTHTRAHTWNSILGLDPKLCFAPSEESHSFQWSLDQTVPCQWSEWLRYNYLGIKVLLDTSRNDIILALHLLPKKNET